MKVLRVLIVALLAAQPTCLAQNFQVGQRVFIESINEYGTVLETTNIKGVGGKAVNVRMDKTGGVTMYDPSHLKAAGGQQTAGNNPNINQMSGGGAVANPNPVGDLGLNSSAQPPGASTGPFKRGDRVFIPSINEYGTVLETTNFKGVGGKAVNVRMDKTGGVTLYDPSHLQPSNVGTPNLDTTLLPHSGPGTVAPTNQDPNQNQANPAPRQELNGAGMPPSGQYKGIITIGKSMMGSQGMTINGNHYTAGSLSGTISMGPGGRLSFSNGLGGLQGCKINYGIYVPVGANHPTIEVFITTPGGKGCQIDYSLE